MSGYKIIDLKNKNLVVDGSPVYIPGVYNAIEESYRKPTMVSGIVIGGVEKNARYVVFGADSDSFRGGMGYSTDGDVMGIVVTNADMVSITSTI